MYFKVCCSKSPKSTHCDVFYTLTNCCCRWVRLPHVKLPASCCSVQILRWAILSDRNVRRLESLRRVVMLYNNVPMALSTPEGPLVQRACGHQGQRADVRVYIPQSDWDSEAPTTELSHVTDRSVRTKTDPDSLKTEWYKLHSTKTS